MSENEASVIEQLRYRLAFEDILMEVSSSFITVSFDEIDSTIQEALGKIGIFFGVDRSYVFRYTSGRDSFDNTHEWCVEGIDSQIDNLQNVPTDVAPWWMGTLKQHKVVHIPSVKNLPAEAMKERALLGSQNIQSMVAVPMVYGEELQGFIGFDAVHSAKNWSDDSIRLLRFVGEVFANALARKEIDRAKSEFMLLVSHQLRTPVSAVKWNTELLTQHGLSGSKEESEKMLQDLGIASERLSDILRILILVSEVELRQYASRYESLDICSLFESVATAVAMHQGREGSTFKIECDGANCSSVVSDKNALEMIAAILLTNASQYSRKDKEVLCTATCGLPGDFADIPEDVQVDAQRKYVYIRVQDRGIGISQDQQQYIFNKLFRGANAMQVATEGNGLGLYIVKSLLDYLEGAVWFTSREGAGSTFVALVPCKED